MPCCRCVRCNVSLDLEHSSQHRSCSRLPPGPRGGARLGCDSVLNGPRGGYSGVHRDCCIPLDYATDQPRRGRRSEPVCASRPRVRKRRKALLRPNFSRCVTGPIWFSSVPLTINRSPDAPARCKIAVSVSQALSEAIGMPTGASRVALSWGAQSMTGAGRICRGTSL